MLKLGKVPFSPWQHILNCLVTCSLKTDSNVKKFNEYSISRFLNFVLKKQETESFAHWYMRWRRWIGGCDTGRPGARIFPGKFILSPGLFFVAWNTLKYGDKSNSIAYFYKFYPKFSQNRVKIGPKFVSWTQITKSKTVFLPQPGKIFSAKWSPWVLDILWSFL